MKTELELMAKHNGSLEEACCDLEKAATSMEALRDVCTAEHSLECAAYTLLEEMVDCVVALSRSQMATSQALHKHLLETHKIGM